MSILFTGREMLETAIEVERNGFSFYSELARAGKARFTFEHLAGQEKRHESLFQGMLDSLGQAPTPESYDGELALYIKTLASGRVFKSPQEAREMAQKLSPGEAIRLCPCHSRRDAIQSGELCLEGQVVDSLKALATWSQA